MTHLPDHSGKLHGWVLGFHDEGDIHFRVVNRILVAGADHLRKGLVVVVGRTLNTIPERDELGRIASEC